jgi:hypothetical protein
VRADEKLTAFLELESAIHKFVVDAMSQPAALRLVYGCLFEIARVLVGLDSMP